MSILLIGANHKTAPVHIREQLAFGEGEDHEEIVAGVVEVALELEQDVALVPRDLDDFAGEVDLHAIRALGHPRRVYPGTKLGFLPRCRP